MIPNRGLVLVRKVEVEDAIRGIIAPPEAVDKWTAQQVIVVDVGLPVLYEEIPDRLSNKRFRRVQIGYRLFYQRDEPPIVRKDDWILIYPRTLSPTGERDLYMVTFDNVMGVFHEHSD